MHLHQSIIDQEPARTSSAMPTVLRRRCSSDTSPACRSICRGHVVVRAQREQLPAHQPLSSAPDQRSWGTIIAPPACACHSGPEARRVENRVGGARCQSLSRHPLLPWPAATWGWWSPKPSDRYPEGACEPGAIAASRPWPKRCGCCGESSPWSSVREIASYWASHGSQGGRVRTFAQVISSVGARASSA